MLEVVREQFLIYGSMENYLTAGDLALIENRRGWNNGGGVSAPTTPIQSINP